MGVEAKGPHPLLAFGVLECSLNLEAGVKHHAVDGSIALRPATRCGVVEMEIKQG